MKRRLLSILYLVANQEKAPLNTNNAQLILNKIPCEHEHFFQLSGAQQYSLKELSEYPISVNLNSFTQPEDTNSTDEQSDASFVISKMLLELPSDLNYLEIEEARDWLKDLNRESKARNRESLRLLCRHLRETLNDGKYETHVEQSVLLLIE